MKGKKRVVTLVKKKDKKIRVFEFQDLFQVKIRHCKTCEAECDMPAPIVGCESTYVPIPPLKHGKNVYGAALIRRVCFDKNYEPVDFWRQPEEREWNQLKNGQMTRKQWRDTLKKELEGYKVKKHD